MVSDVNKCDFLILHVKCGNIGKSYIIQWADIFQMTSGWIKGPFTMQDRSMEGRKVNWLVSDFMLQLPVLKICWVLVSYQKNIHNFLRRLLKYLSLFQLHICVSPKFLHILQPKLCECRSTYEKLPILGGNIAVFH